jgi:hypothetical protein
MLLNDAGYDPADDPGDGSGGFASQGQGAA